MTLNGCLLTEAFVKAHQDGASVKAPSEQAIEKSRTGNSTRENVIVRKETLTFLKLANRLSNLAGDT